mgnify:FL=1
MLANICLNVMNYSMKKDTFIVKGVLKIRHMHNMCWHVDEN